MAISDSFPPPTPKLARLLAIAALGLALSGFGSCLTTADLLLPGAHGVGLHTGSSVVDYVRLRAIGFSVWYPTDAFPGVHPDTLACAFLPPVDPEYSIAFDYLTERTPDTGFVSPGPAALPCEYGAQDLSWMEKERQYELTKASVLAFAQSHFAREHEQRILASAYLRKTFDAENPDATLEAKRPAWDWLGTQLD